MPKTKHNRKYKRKTRRGGSKQYRYGNVTNLNEKLDGLSFFRKYGTSIVERKIYSILQNNPHPNIVKVYHITDRYIDIELLNPVIEEFDEEALITAAEAAKKHLQSLGIMYIDWKPDNFGVAADGTYKIFDFDVSGIVSSNSNKWRIHPPEYWKYRQASAHGLKDPKEINDFAFDIGLKKRNDYVPV